MERNVDLLKSQFDIDREPFSDAGISGLFYPGAGRQQVLEQLLHLVRYGPPLLFVVGEEGSGKTLLSHQLDRQLDSAIFSCVSIEATVLMDDRALMALICDGFNLHVELSRGPVVSALVRFASESESYSQTALVVIDGVQNLSEVAAEFLAEVAKLVKDSGLRFLLLADTTDIQQEGVLASLVGLMDSFGQSLQLSALDVTEVADYLSYRMRTAGLDGVRFSPQQVKQISGESEGVISQINQFARETLVHQVPVVTKEKKRQVISFWHLIVVAVISTGIVWLMLGRQATESYVEMESKGEVLPRMSGQESLIKSPAEREDVTFVDIERSELVDLNYAENEPPAGDALAKDLAPQSKADKFFAVETIEAIEKMEWDDSVNVAPNKVAASRALVNKTVLTKVVTNKALSDKVEAINVEATKIEASKAEVINAAPFKEKPLKPVVSALSKVTPKKPVKNSTQQNKIPRLNEYTLREKWLLSLDPKQYTLQMIGARDEAAVQEFISRYPSLTKVAYYKTLYKGSDWYVVIYGQFATKDDARQAVTRLPKNLIASKPWARPLASVQKGIRMARL